MSSQKSPLLNLLKIQGANPIGFAPFLLALFDRVAPQIIFLYLDLLVHQLRYPE
jgi:hypothetical protein